MNQKNQSLKAGLPPGTLIHLGEKKVDRALISIMRYSSTDFVEQTNCSIEDVEKHLNSEGITWVNIDGIHDPEIIEKVGKLIKMHPLLMEGILNTFQRPKYEDYDHHVYLNLKMLGIAINKRTIISEQIGFVLGENYIVSFQEQPGDLFDTIRNRLRENKGQVRVKKSDYLFYRFIDTIVDNYFLITEHLSLKNEALEDQVLKNPTPEILNEIQHIKKSLIRVKKAVVPLREAVNAIQREENPLIRESTRPFIRNVYEHISQVMEWCDTQRDTVGGVMDLYLSEISNRMNEVMKTLTIIATIFIPLTFIAGIYGMNFEYIPELQWHYGYHAFWLIIVIMTVLMVVYFRKKKWF